MVQSLTDLEPNYVPQTDHKLLSNRDIFEQSEHDALEARVFKQEEQTEEQGVKMIN